MIVKSINKLPLKPTDGGKVYPILPVKVGLLFPGNRRRYNINRKSSLALLEECRSGDSPLIISFSPTPRDLTDGAVIPLSEVSVVAKVTNVREGRGETKDVEFEGLERVALCSVTSRSPFVRGEARLIQERPKLQGAAREKTLAEVIDLCEKVIERGASVDPKLQEVIREAHATDGAFADAVTAHAPLNPTERQTLLETIDLRARFDLLRDLLRSELDRISLSLQLGHRAEAKMEENRRREYLELKLEEIKKQLGGAYDEEKASSALKRRIQLATNLPNDVRELAWEEASRLAILPIGAAEYASVRHFVETLISLPWTRESGSATADAPLDMQKIEATIFKDYYGSDKTKRRIIERISSNILTGGSEKGPIICFMGAAGTGKATLARAIAKGLNREFLRMSLGSILDIMEIKGMNRSMIGATPGVFIREMQRLSSPDPVIYIEDLEYLGDGDSSVALALLEVMDHRLNHRFIDSFIGVPFDFSEALFICGVRYPESIPEVIDNRIEPIEIPGYIEKEKVSIARKHLIPPLLKKYGLTRTDVSITADGLVRLIRDYTMESGILEFSRLLDRIFRHVVNEIRLKKRKKWKLDSTLLESAFGAPIYIPEKPVKEPQIGLATGLAWTGVGGELMLIECLKMRGDGNIVYTGSLGEVMRESIQAAHSYIRSKADMLGIDHDDFKNFDIHVHFPSGAIPKDGPSAGIAVSLVIASVMAERPIRNDMAVTGEVSLQGNVLPVGGIKEKVAAAHRANIPYVCMPRENEKDLKDLPKEITRSTKFIFVGSVDELFEQALLDFTPSSYTLEKMFAVELEKARRKRSSTVSKKRKSTRKVAKKKK